MAGADFGNWAGGSLLAEFADATCNPDHVSATSALDGTGGRLTVDFASYSGGAEWCYGDTAQVRVHLSGFSGSGPSLDPGAEIFWPWSIRRRAGSHASSVVLNELHAEHVGCTLGGGPAPFNFQCRNDGGTPRWAFVFRGWDDCAGPGFVQHMFGASATFSAVGDGSNQGDRVPHAWAGGLSDAAADDEWLHVMLRILLDGDPNVGTVQAWACKGTSAPEMVEIIPETQIATCYPITNYPILSVYYANTSGTADYEYAAGRIFDDLAEAQAWQTARLEGALGADPWGGSGGGGGSTRTVVVDLASDDDDYQLSRHDTAYATAAAGGGTYVLNSDGATLLHCTRGNYGSPDYWIECFLLRFLTGDAIEAELAPGETLDTVTRATLRYNVPTTGSDVDNRAVVAEWIPDWAPVGSADWSSSNAADALNVDLTTLNVAGDGEHDLDNPASVATGAGAVTALRFNVSGGQPANANHWRIAAREHSTGRPPSLELEFTVTVDPPSPSGSAPGRRDRWARRRRR